MSGFGTAFATEDQKGCTIDVYSHLDVELFHTVAFLSSIEQYSNCQLLTSVFLYKAKEFFAPWKDHLVVQQYNELKKEDLIDLVYPILLQDKTWEDVDTDLYVMEADREKIENFLETMQDFSQESNFDQFMTTMKHPYSQIVSSFRLTDHIQEEITTAEVFFGYSFRKVHVLLCPTRLYEMNTLVTLDPDSHEKDLFILASLTDVHNGYLQFGTKDSFSDLLSETVPVFLFQQAIQYYGLKMDQFTEQTNQLFVSQLCEALRIAAFGTVYTGMPVEDYLHLCDQKGDTFVSPICSLIEQEYTTAREEYAHFISYTPQFYQSIMALYDGGDV
jgi:hypothetical protein